MKSTIIIPACQEEKTIEACLKSISAQTKKEHVSCVIVENGSTDSTYDLIKSFPADYELILHSEAKRIGASNARNKGIEIALKAFNPCIIITCDADTRISPNTIEEIQKATEKGYMGGTIKAIYDAPKISAKLQETIINQTSMIWSRFSLPFPAYTPLLFFNRKFIKKQLENKGQIWEPGIGMGEELVIQRDMAKAGRIKYISQAHAITSMRRSENQGYLKMFVCGVLGQLYKGQKWSVEDRL